MAVTLAEARRNAQSALDVSVIDAFRVSPLLDYLVFDDAVNPSGGGATLTYGYRRETTLATAGTRAINAEYTPQEVVTTPETVDLAVMGGSFDVDRVLARVGPAASGAVAVNLRAKIKATIAKFNELAVIGDTAVDANGFDGLDKILTSTSTEIGASVVTDWSDLDTDPTASQKALDAIDEFLMSLDGTPTLLIGNDRVLARVRAIARRSQMYTRSPVDGLAGQNGRPIVRESYGDLTWMDAGNKPGTSQRIIPIETRTVGGNSVANLTDLYAIRIDEGDGVHGVSTVGAPLVQTYLPDFNSAGAVKKGEVEMGPVALAVKSTECAAVLRNIKVA